MRIVFETKTTKALKFVTESIFEKFLHARQQFGLKTNCVCSQLGNDVLKIQMFTFHSVHTYRGVFGSQPNWTSTSFWLAHKKKYKQQLLTQN